MRKKGINVTERDLRKKSRSQETDRKIEKIRAKYRKRSRDGSDQDNRYNMRSDDENENDLVIA